MQRNTKIKLCVFFVLVPVLLLFCFRDSCRQFIESNEIFTKVISRKSRITLPENVFKTFDFSKQDSLKKWRNKIFKGKTEYWIDEKENEVFLHSMSKGAASALYHLVSYRITDYPFISWQWRPKKFPDKRGIKDPILKDDYALRLYVIFASGFFTNFRCVEYVWDEKLPAGTKMVSPYSDKIMQLVVRSGLGSGQWQYEERNVLEDYISLFGKKPRAKVRAIAVMSDSEGTRDTSEANFREIKITKE